MAESFVYRNAFVYESVMRALYGVHYEARSRAVAALIPARSSVLDLCCGPGILYRRHLRSKAIDYTGLDINPGFIKRTCEHGGRGIVWDLHSNRPLPKADTVLMQASLYQFLPDPSDILRRMCRAARERVIVSEPVRNLSDAGIPLLSSYARRHTDAGQGVSPRRFNEETLDELFRSLGMEPIHAFLISGGREKVVVLRPESDEASSD